MVAFRLMVQTTVHDYLVYKDVWTPAISKESICCQDQQSLTDMLYQCTEKEKMYFDICLVKL